MRTAAIILFLFCANCLGQLPPEFLFLARPAGISVAAPDYVTLTNGLVAWWKLDEGSGSSVSDSVSTNNGVGTDLSWATGKYGNYAGNFNGASTDVAFKSFNLTNLTFSAWINPTGAAGNVYGTIYSKRGAAADWSYYLRWNGNYCRPQVQINKGGTTYETGVVSTSVPTNTWTHIAFRSDTDKVCIYTNGILYSIGRAPGAIASSTASNRLGIYTLGNYYFQGYIDDARVYDYSLQPSDIYFLSSATNLTATNTTTKTNLVTDGDSITAGGSSGTIGWPMLLRTNYGTSGIDVQNVAVSGDVYLNIANRLITHSKRYSTNSSTNIMVLFGGSNDIATGVNTNDTWARITESIEATKRLGYGVAICTILARTNLDSAKALARTNINIRIRNEATNWGAFKIIDLTTNALLDWNVNPGNFLDGVHPTQFGQYLLATNVQSVLFP